MSGLILNIWCGIWSIEKFDNMEDINDVFWHVLLELNY